jgi:predicted transcriptional regulator
MATAAALEQRKLLIIDYLSTLEDESILHQVENLLVPNVDFWNELNEFEKAKIERGLQQAENGEALDFEDFINNFSK